MSDSEFGSLQQLNREHLHHIWQRARNGELDGLTEEEQRLARVMLAHSDEYFNSFEFADVLGDHEFDPDSEVNPFLHITLHAIAEKQVEDRNPIEALQFYNAMLKRKCSRHEAIHLLAGILIYFLLPVLKERQKFQFEAYRRILREYKSRKPDKIIDLLEKEPNLIEGEPDKKAARMLDEMQSALEDQNFGSVEDAQVFANAFADAKNREPVPEFLGLSPEQMYRLLYRPLTDTSDILILNKNLPKEGLSHIPVVKEIVYLLRRLGELQPLRATVKGNLPRAFAQEMHDTFRDPHQFDYPIMSEEEDWKLIALRHLLTMCGWIRKHKQRFGLTRAGKRLVDNGFGSEDFFHLLETYMLEFNWASRDSYPELYLIQQSVLFSCYLLHVKAKAYIHADELGKYFIEAFPAVLNQVAGNSYTTPEELVKSAFSTRFIEAFCEYFGFVTIRREEKEKSWKVDRFLQTTPLFEEIFQWRSI